MSSGILTALNWKEKPSARGRWSTRSLLARRASKKDLLGRGPLVDGTDYSRIRAIHEFANFYKHEDEWTDETWDRPRWNMKPTVEVMKALGLGRHSSIQSGASRLGLETGGNIAQLASDVSKWAATIAAEAEEAAAPFMPKFEINF